MLHNYNKPELIAFPSIRELFSSELLRKHDRFTKKYSKHAIEILVQIIDQPLSPPRKGSIMVKETVMNNECVVDRRRVNRRIDLEIDNKINGSDNPTEEKRKTERRRQIDPTTCERDYTDDEVDFMKAMDIYKRRSGRQFPTWSEVLEVLRSMGYRKVEEPVEIVIESR